MLKITLFDKTEKCNELVSVNISHISMFEDGKISFIFASKDDEQLKLIVVLIKAYIKFECIGDTIELNMKERQKINFRFDSIR